MDILSTISYMLEKVKKTALNRLKLKTILFIYYPRSSRTEFFNKLIASDFLVL